LRLLRLHRVLRRVLLRLRRDRGRQGRVSAEARGRSGSPRGALALYNKQKRGTRLVQPLTRDFPQGLPTEWG
jgi:hypothetical protein